MKVVTVEQMRRVEAAADAAGHTYAAMMEQAGLAVAEAVMARTRVAGAKVLVLVGPGNNGGDGLVAARALAIAGAEVACYLIRPRKARKDENLRKLQEMSVYCTTAEDDASGRVLVRLAQEVDIVVDALLGTGTALPVKGAVAEVLQRMWRVLDQRARQAPPRCLSWLGETVPPFPGKRPLVVAVDGPSGLDFDSGALDEAALPADLTVTFAYPKIGHFRFPGATALGDLAVADIGIDPSLAADIALETATSEAVRSWLPQRPPDSHKGTFGRALIVAGSSNYTGAARLAGAAAVRAGAGLVTVALPASIHGIVAAGLVEATFLLLPHELGVVAKPAAEVVAGELGRCDALLVGPGLGREQETEAFFEGLFAGAGRRSVGFRQGDEQPARRAQLPPLVVDADGLNILAGLSDWPALLPANAILTPHPGEMARLMDCPIEHVQADRVQVCRRQAREWGHVVVLKGAYTVVAAPDGRAVLEPFANAGLATGGTGDVLAGIVVALLAQGLEAFEAAAAGAFLHGLAGALAATELGVAGIGAGDLLGLIPRVWQQVVGTARR